MKRNREYIVECVNREYFDATLTKLEKLGYRFIPSLILRYPVCLNFNTGEPEILVVYDMEGNFTAATLHTIYKRPEQYKYHESK